MHQIIRWTPKLKRQGWVGLGTVAICASIELVGYLLRQIPIEFNPLVWAGVQIIAALLGFTIAANVLLRFFGTGDRLSLLLGLGIGLIGLIQLGGILALLRERSVSVLLLRVPVTWMVGGTLFALLMLIAPVLDKHLPWPHDPEKAVGAALALVGVIGAMIALGLFIFPFTPIIRRTSLIPRPWDLAPAALFLTSMVLIESRRRSKRTAFDAAVITVAGANAAAYLLSSQSSRLLDVPAIVAQFVAVGSYALLLAATLLDNTRLFSQVRRRATSDSLTGLANYEAFLEVLQSELGRSGRTDRSFSVLLMDLDGLKQINDVYGHIVGSEAICRVARILQQECRSIDTAARYGGDEFGLILPEAGREAAQKAAERIRKRVAADPGEPRLSLSVGTSTHPIDGGTAKMLLTAADHELYAAKSRSKGGQSQPSEHNNNK